MGLLHRTCTHQTQRLLCWRRLGDRPREIRCVKAALRQKADQLFIYLNYILSYVQNGLPFSH
jgi:hypothetical protein